MQHRGKIFTIHRASKIDIYNITQLLHISKKNSNYPTEKWMILERNEDGQKTFNFTRNRGHLSYCKWDDILHSPYWQKWKRRVTSTVSENMGDVGVRLVGVRTQCTRVCLCCEYVYSGTAHSWCGELGSRCQHLVGMSFVAVIPFLRNYHRNIMTHLHTVKCVQGYSLQLCS